MAEVLIADYLHDAGQSVLDSDFLQDQWSRVGFDLATDAWVVVHREDECRCRESDGGDEAL